MALRFDVLRQLFEPAVNALSTDQRASLFEGAASLAKTVTRVGRPGGARSSVRRTAWAVLAGGGPHCRPSLLPEVDGAY